MVKIYYDNNDIFQITPFIGRGNESIFYGGRWGQATNLTLRGQITGCSDWDLFVAQNTIISGLHKDFKTLKVMQDAAVLEEFPYCQINSIDFESSVYSKIVNYTVSATAYESELFSGVYGVLDPVNEFNYTLEQNGVISISHTISAKGFKTNKNALDNAREWCYSYSGWNSGQLPFFIDVCSGLNPVLFESSESFDPFEGTYQISETYRADPRGNSGVLSYSFDFNSGLSDWSTISIKGEVIGNTIEEARGRYFSFNPYSKTLDYYSGISNRLDLNPEPLNSGVTENGKTLTFDITFDNNPRPLTYVDYTISESYNKNESKWVGTVEGEIISRKQRGERMAAKQAFFSGLDVFKLLVVNAEYSGYNSTPLSYSKTQNQFDETLSFSASYSNGTYPISGLQSFDFSASIRPSITQKSDVPLQMSYNSFNTPHVMPAYETFSLFKNRAQISINGNARSFSPDDSNLVSKVNNQAFGIFKEIYTAISGSGEILLEQNEISQSTNQVSFNFSWSFESPLFV